MPDNLISVCMLVQIHLAFPDKFDLSKQGASQLSVEREGGRKRERAKQGQKCVKQ